MNSTGAKIGFNASIFKRNHRKETSAQELHLERIKNTKQEDIFIVLQFQEIYKFTYGAP